VSNVNLGRLLNRHCRTDRFTKQKHKLLILVLAIEDKSLFAILFEYQLEIRNEALSDKTLIHS